MSPAASHALGKDALELVASRFRVLAEPLRLEILQVLGQGERTVSELATAVGSTAPNVSKHLRNLEEAGFISRRQDGNSVVCKLIDDTVFRLCEHVCEGLRERLLAQADLLSPARRRRPVRRARA